MITTVNSPAKQGNRLSGILENNHTISKEQPGIPSAGLLYCIRISLVSAAAALLHACPYALISLSFSNWLLYISAYRPPFARSCSKRSPRS